VYSKVVEGKRWLTPGQHTARLSFEICSACWRKIHDPMGRAWWPAMDLPWSRGATLDAPRWAQYIYIYVYTNVYIYIRNQISIEIWLDIAWQAKKHEETTQNTSAFDMPRHAWYLCGDLCNKAEAIKNLAPWASKISGKWWLMDVHIPRGSRYGIIY
jgi:hypothetical protein